MYKIKIFVIFLLQLLKLQIYKTFKLSTVVQNLIIKNYFVIFKYWQTDIVWSYSSSLIL